MKIKQNENTLVIKDSSKNIDCIYDGTKLSGKGSRASKDIILQEIEKYKIQNGIEKVKSVQSSETDDYRDIASLSAFINAFGGENVRTPSVTLETIKKWESNPIKYAYQLYKHSLYLMGENGLVARTIDMFTNLHGLSSSLEYTNANDENLEEDLKKIKLYDSYINKETVLRDILRASAHGTYMGLIVRNRFIHSLDIELYTPTTLVDGYWKITCDLLNLTTANDNRTIYDYPNEYQEENYNPKEELISRQPEIVQQAFRNWQVGIGQRYFELPVDKTVVIKNASLQQERFGRPYAMGVFKELLHRELLKQAEEVLIDKLIHSIYVLTLGEKGKESDGNMKPTPDQRKVIGNAVKSVLNKTNDASDGEKSLVVGLPWWAEMEELSVNLELFKTKKYEEVNISILQGLGVADLLGASDTGSYASANISVDLFMKNVLNIIAQIEDQVFNRQYRIITKNMNNIFFRKFSRGTMVLGKDKIEVLKHLLSFGGSIKFVLDELGINFESYIEQVKKEKNIDKLHQLFEPFRTSSTMSSNENGRPSEGGEGTNGNETPRPSTE